MKAPRAPQLDERRAPEFLAELEARARVWIPDWELGDGEHDFGRALLQIAARFNSEIAERLDGAGEKMRRGFLDWLAVRGEAARPARMPVVFQLADSAREAVLAAAPVRLQADAAGTPVVFETEKDVRVVPGRLEVVVGTDAEQDAFYLPPPGLGDLQPLAPLPTQWQLKSFAAAAATKLQLDPETGLAVDMIIEADGTQYRIVQAENGIVTIDPGLDADLNASSTIRKVAVFAPFDGATRNRQEHALYLGHMDLLNIEAEATIDVVGASALVAGITWQYWGKKDTSDEIGWQPLALAPPDELQPGAVALKKPAGALEPCQIGAAKSRWIRAYSKQVDGTIPRVQVDRLSIRVNCRQELPPCPQGSAPVEASVAAEAMANTTPLVLDNLFFPLGKEPRQFDAFYLGSQEAFSKKRSKVQLCLEMADRTFYALAAVREGTFENRVLAGVAKDRALHLLSFDPATGAIGKFRNRNPLQPPRPGYAGRVEPGAVVALDEQPLWRLPVWSQSDAAPYAGFLVGTSAGDAIWVWHEHSLIPQHSGWINCGKLPTEGSATNAAVDGLVYLPGENLSGESAVLVALRGGELFRRNWPHGLQWEPVNTLAAGDPIRLASIVPVLVADDQGRLVPSRAEGMIGIDETKKLFRVEIDGICTPQLSAYEFNPEVRPIAVNVGNNVMVAAVTNSPSPKLVAKGTASPKESPLPANTEVVAALEAVLVNGTFHVLATVRDRAGGRLTTWAPFEAGSAAFTFESPVALGAGLVEGAPVAVQRFVVIPGARADILVNQFDPSLRLLKSADIESGVVVPESMPVLRVDDLIVRLDGGEPLSREITEDGLAKEGEVFYPLDAAFPSGTTGLYAYALSNPLAGAFGDPDLTLHVSDRETAAGDWLRVDADFYEVDSVTTLNNQRIATLIVPNSNGSVPPTGQVQYVRPIEMRGRGAPYMRLTTTANGSGDWDANFLNRTPLIFPNERPHKQRGKAFKIAVDNKPEVVVLGEEFENAVTNPVAFLVDAAFRDWQRDAGDTSTNPELSWEYWNGKGWGKLNVTLDETQNLKLTGSLRFVVPSDIASSDWSGKTNFWIRARLIGGDYGREKVTVKVKPDGSGGTEQTVERSLEGIRPPSVLKLRISYQVCDSVEPTFVLTQDSGSLRDQSDANRTGGAIVEAFVPLAAMLGRLSNPAPVPGAAPPRRPACDCQTQHEPTMVTPANAVAVATAESSPAKRELFIGLNATPSEAPVNVLLLVEERQHAAFAPLRVETLVADRFVPIVADDATRALGESGLLTMVFAIPPTPTEMFGWKGLTWVRLLPASPPDGEWFPTLRGAYLNAVWASATETLTRELLGSSDGSPHLTVRLARPPVLRNTLELRVREPLGEEERAALRTSNTNTVISDLDGLPGDWVLWKQVIDPGDEPATERVYALDEASGEIRFGDGVHGCIPPIGRDAIVAFRYCRTEADPLGGERVPGNTISARTTLNLISPVESVESVMAAEQAAGGAPPEADDRVLQFGFARLRHRNRAVTADDIEDLTLQSSPDIAQARAFVHRGHICLVVVMRGTNPQPNAAQVRELRRLLLRAAPVSLSAPEAFRIRGPKVRRLRIELLLLVKSLDHAGALAAFIRSALTGFFDTAAGGVDKEGWALGLNPCEDDVAFALSNAPYLESIENVTLLESVDGGTVRAWRETLKPIELVMLADDPIGIQLKTAAVTE